MFAALIVRRRAKSSRRGGLHVNAFDVPIERKIKVESGLLAIGDDVQPRRDLIVDRGDHGIVLHLGDFGCPELIEMR